MITLTKKEFYIPGLYTITEVEWLNDMYVADTIVKNLCENVLYIVCNNLVRRRREDGHLYFAVYLDEQFHLFETGDYSSDDEFQLSRLIPEIGPMKALEFMEL